LTNAPSSSATLILKIVRETRKAVCNKRIRNSLDFAPNQFREINYLITRDNDLYDMFELFPKLFIDLNGSLTLHGITKGRSHYKPQCSCVAVYSSRLA